MTLEMKELLSAHTWYSSVARWLFPMTCLQPSVYGFLLKDCIVFSLLRRLLNFLYIHLGVVYA